MKFLVISLAGIGDTLFSTPLIQELRANFPDAVIDALVLWPGSRDVLERNPCLSTVFQKNLLEQHKLASLRFLWGLRRRRYDVSINTHPQSRIHYLLVARVINARTRISHGYHRCRGVDRLFINRSLPQDYGKHSVENNMALLPLLGLTPRQPYHDCELFLSPAEAAWAETDHVPEVWEYLAMRQFNNFRPCPTITDTIGGYELPADLHARPEMQRVIALAGNATTIVNATTKAFIADDTDGDATKTTLRVSKLNITATHTSQYDSELSSIQASLLGYSGGWAPAAASSTATCPTSRPTVSPATRARSSSVASGSSTTWRSRAGSTRRWSSSTRSARGPTRWGSCPSRSIRRRGRSSGTSRRRSATSGSFRAP